VSRRSCGSRLPRKCSLALACTLSLYSQSARTLLRRNLSGPHSWARFAAGYHSQLQRVRRCFRSRRSKSFTSIPKGFATFRHSVHWWHQMVFDVTASLPRRSPLTCVCGWSISISPTLSRMSGCMRRSRHPAGNTIVLTALRALLSTLLMAVVVAVLHYQLSSSTRQGLVVHLTRSSTTCCSCSRCEPVHGPQVPLMFFCNVGQLLPLPPCPEYYHQL